MNILGSQFISVQLMRNLRHMCLALLLPCCGAWAQDPPATNFQIAGSLANVVRQPVTVPKFATSPVIDGKLDDEVWKHAAVLKDLIQTGPGDNIAASRPT